MKKYITAITVLLLFACSDHDTYPENSAVAKACKVCQTNPTEMQWLREIIQENNGNVYAINTSAGVYIIHQPVYMSCLACVRYTCSGSQPASVPPAVQEELQNGIKESNLIYEATF
jgi:hypothetical protein